MSLASLQCIFMKSRLDLKMKRYRLEVIEKKPIKRLSPFPLIFIHGAAGGAWYFSNFLDYFSEKGFQCYAISLRGHGLSEGIEDIDTFTLHDYVNDVKSLVDQLDQKPILIGHSMGGAITQSYIGLYQKTIHQAILLSSARAGGIDESSPLGLFFSDSRTFLRELRKKEGHEKMTIDDLLNEVIFSDRFESHVLVDIKRKLSRESKVVKEDLLKTFIKEGFKLEIPVHVIGSTGDHIISLDDLKKTADFFHTTPILVKDCCHFLTIDPNWMEVAETIYMILSTNSG